MVQNAESYGIASLIKIDILKVIPSIFIIYVCGFWLQEKFDPPIKNTWHSTMIRSFGVGLCFMGISFIPSLFIFKNFVLKQIVDLQIINETGSLFNAFFLVTIIVFYFPLVLFSYIFLCWYNNKKENQEIEELRRPLFK